MSANILLADDDTSLRFVLSQALGKEGYNVRATGNVATLAKWVREGEGDLVLSDVYMGDECVFDALPNMRTARPNLPVIVMSAQSTVTTALSAAGVAPPPQAVNKSVSIGKTRLKTFVSNFMLCPLRVDADRLAASRDLTFRRPGPLAGQTDRRFHDQDGSGGPGAFALDARDDFPHERAIRLGGDDQQAIPAPRQLVHDLRGRIAFDEPHLHLGFLPVQVAQKRLEMKASR